MNSAAFWRGDLSLIKFNKITAIYSPLVPQHVHLFMHNRKMRYQIKPKLNLEIYRSRPTECSETYRIEVIFLRDNVH